MKSCVKSVLGTACALLILAGGVESIAGEPARRGDIEVAMPWARASIGTSRPAAAYMTIRNTGSQPDRLVSVESPAAKRAEIHTMTMTKGVMRMSAAGPLALAPGATVALKPGGLHVMLMGLRAPLKRGGTTSLVLTFERAGRLEVMLPIMGPGARSPHAGGHKKH